MEDPQVTAELLHKIMQFTRDTGAAPAPVRSFLANQVEQAFRTLQNGKNIGRIVIEPSPDDIVPLSAITYPLFNPRLSFASTQKYLLDRQPWKFDSNASYLIAGGSGGIGRAIMKWMATRGANYVIVLSRSGASSPEAAAVIAELESQGVCVVASKCDVASELALSSVLDECARTMPPLKGCINAALVLQDALFENMTLAQWDLAVRAKVDTAWNLHRLLPKDLDFSVLLSSLAGQIGQAATSQYAAGCTFQDSLAR